MLRRPLIRRAGLGLQAANTFTLPAPVGGWNVRDPLAAMPPKDAVTLTNFFPKASDVETRLGAANWVTGFAEQPKTLLAWNGPAASEMYASTDAGIFDVTVDGVLGASVTTCTQGRTQFTNFTTIGGHFLVVVNGTDDMQVYDGTTWTSINALSVPALTGIATDTFETVTVLKRRLWFTVTGSSSAWYLTAASIAGAAVEFPLGQIFTRGGYLVAITNWTVDGGDGSDDYGVFISSEGEVAVYKGTDPASSATWEKVGLYFIGEPIGRNCYAAFGGDVLLLCQNGLFPLSKAIQSATIDKSVSLTDKIDTAFADAAASYSANPGWQICVFPQGNFLLVNIPVSDTYSMQFVMNTTTRAWCTFTGWYAMTWLVFQTKLYFGEQLKVAQAWTGVSDFGAAIVCEGQQAYNYFNRLAMQKHVKLVRPIVNIDNDVFLELSLDMDFARAAPPSGLFTARSAGARWDVDRWDEAPWAAGAETKREWATIFAKEGYAASFRLQLSTNTAILKWTATDFVFERGGVL